MSFAALAERLPIIRAQGTNYEIGYAHGSQGRSQVGITLRNLQRSVKTTVGQDWAVCVKIASAFLPVVERRFPAYLEEIKGIADGSGHSFEDIFTLNCRTELGQQFGRRPAQNAAQALSLAGGCSVVGANHTRTATGTTIYGQNWDADPAQRETMVFVVARQKEKPDIAWAGEAGLICRMAGVNSAGIGLGGNTLFCNAPIDFEGLPLQFTYRSIMDQSSFPDAVEAAAMSRLASCNNLMVCGPEGEMVNIERDYKGYGMLYMKEGLIAHANHYRHPKLPRSPYREMDLYPKDELRAFRLEYLMERLPERGVTAEDLMGVLSDHGVNYPASVCQHLPNCATNFSTVIDLNRLEMHIAVGNPCGGYISLRPFAEDGAVEEGGQP